MAIGYSQDSLPGKLKNKRGSHALYEKSTKATLDPKSSNDKLSGAGLDSPFKRMSECPKQVVQ